MHAQKLPPTSYMQFIEAKHMHPFIKAKHNLSLVHGAPITIFNRTIIVKNSAEQINFIN